MAQPVRRTVPTTAQGIALPRRSAPASEAQILNGLAEARYASGQLDQALAQHTGALILATERGDRYEQARVHHGLAHTHHSTGDLHQARHHCQLALTLYTDLDVPDADHARTHLATLTPRSAPEWLHRS